MAIYVQSRGISQENDYRWLKIKESRQIPEIPPILKRPITGPAQTPVRVTDAIDSHTPSIVLARSDGELLLLLTGLEARQERTDFTGRKLRNSIAWVYPDAEEEERKIRSLAVRALKGELEAEVDKAVNIGGEYGFEVSLDAIRQLANPEEVESLAPNFTVICDRNLPELREGFARELQQHCLPKHEGLLLVVTGIKTKSALVKAGVWRGLSNRIEADKPTDSPDAIKGTEATPPAMKTPRSGQKKTLLTVTIVAIALILTAFLAIGWLIPLVQESPQQPTQQSLSMDSSIYSARE